MPRNFNFWGTLNKFTLTIVHKAGVEHSQTNSENTYARKSYFQCILLRTAGGKKIRALQISVSKLKSLNS